MKTYLVRARSRDGGWDLDIKGVGLTRAPRLTAAERAVRAHLDVLGFADFATAGLEFEYGAELEREIRSVREGRASADAASRFAAERTRALASRLVADGLNGAEVAMVLGVTPQRVSQLVAAPGAAGAAAARRARRADATRADAADPDSDSASVRTKGGKTKPKKPGKAKAKKKQKGDPA